MLENKSKKELIEIIRGLELENEKLKTKKRKKERAPIKTPIKDIVKFHS